MEKETKTEPNICNVCQESGLQYAFSAPDYITGDNFELWLCPQCQAMTTLPQLSNEELQKYYQDIYYGRRKSLVDKIINKERMWTVVSYSERSRVGTRRSEESSEDEKVGKRFLVDTRNDDTPSILDIGCGNGLFLNVLKKVGWKISGTELAPESHVHTEVLQFVCKKPINECAFAKESFDIITMWHTLEHFINPHIYLKEANQLLKRGGILIIEVPNFKSWQFFLTGKHWFPLEIPRHRTHFSPQALKIILEKNGFQIIKISHGNFFYDIFGFTQSVLNYVCGQKNILFNILNGKFSASANDTRNIFDISATIILTPPLAVIGIILYGIEILTKHSGTIRIFSQKTVN